MGGEEVLPSRPVVELDVECIEIGPRAHSVQQLGGNSKLEAEVDEDRPLLAFGLLQAVHAGHSEFVVDMVRAVVPKLVELIGQLASVAGVEINS